MKAESRVPSLHLYFVSCTFQYVSGMLPLRVDPKVLTSKCSLEARSPFLRNTYLHLLRTGLGIDSVIFLIIVAKDYQPREGLLGQEKFA